MQLVALLRLGFPSAPYLKYLTSLHTVTRWLVLQKAHHHTHKVLWSVVGTWFQVLFHSPPGVLFTFPSRYCFTIGHQVVFSLGRWSSLLPTRFLVSRGTLVQVFESLLFTYRAFTVCGPTFQLCSLKLPLSLWPDLNPRNKFLVWALSLSLAATWKIDLSFSSSGYLDVSVPRVCLWSPMYSDSSTQRCLGGFPHSDISGSLAICAYPELFAAYRVLLRLLVPRHPPCALCSLTFSLKIATNFAFRRQVFRCGAHLHKVSSAPPSSLSLNCSLLPIFYYFSYC